MKKIFLLFLLVLIGKNILAQEQRIVTQFFMNPYVYNPAYAGAEGHTAIYVMYRNQWVGLDDGPSFANANFHVPLKGGFAIGALAFNDQESIIKTSGAKISLGYLVALDKKHYLRFGMSLGAGTERIDTDQIDNPFDPAFSGIASNTSFMIADFGMTYHFGHFNVGFALPNLISREIISDESFSKINITPLNNMLFKVNFRGHINDNFAIEPHLIYRFSTVNQSQYEVATILHLKHIVWVGAAYRQDAGFAGLAGIKIKEHIAVGFAYEPGNPSISRLTGATYEIQIGYHLGDKKKHHDHSHSFIKSHKKSADERAAEAERRKLANERRVRAAEDRAATVAAAAAAREATAQAVKAEEEIEAIPPTEETEVDQPANTEMIPVDNNEPEDIPIIDDTAPPATPVVVTGRSGVTVKRGSHFLELRVGHHVIAGAFKQFQHAEDFSDQLFNRGFHDTIVGFSTAKGYYYVVVFHGTNYDKAETEKNRIKNAKGLEHVWVLTVE